MKISIAMTTYNGESYIQEQLDSFKRQTLQPDELIISDDGSTDQTIHICHEFANDVKFKVAVLENEQSLGVQKNFEKVMYNCSGDVVFLSDQDDVWYDNKIEEVMKEFNTTDKQLIIHDLEYCDSKLEPIGETTIERLHRYMKLKDAYVVGMATAVKRELLDILLPLPNYSFISYDGWIHTCANLLNGKYILFKSLAYYRRHESNHTRGYSVNYPGKATKLFFFKEKMLNSFKKVDLEELKNSIEYFKLQIQWLRKNNNELKRLGIITDEILLKEIQVLTDSYKIRTERLQILNIDNRIIRFINCINFLIKGNYSYFNGLKSFIKDIGY